MKIADGPPDIILITEVIPKAQTIPLDGARLNIPGVNVFLNFDLTLCIAILDLQVVEVLPFMCPT